MTLASNFTQLSCESLHRILHGHFSLIFVVKIVMFVSKDENKRKRGRGRPIYKKRLATELCVFDTVEAISKTKRLTFKSHA